MLPNRLIISVFNIRVTAKLTALSCSPFLPLSLSLCLSNDVFIFSCRRLWLHSPANATSSLLLGSLALLVVVYVLLALLELPDDGSDDVNCDAGNNIGGVCGIFE